MSNGVRAEIASTCNQIGSADIALPGWASIGHPCSQDAPALSLPTAARDSLPADPDSLSSRDARWARLARVVPGGWGGGHFLDHGVPTTYLTDTSRRIEAVAASTNAQSTIASWDPMYASGPVVGISHSYTTGTAI